MRYLTVDEVLEINAEVLGGTHALRERGLLESALARPQASGFGVDAYPDIYSKTAALLHSLILNHPFVDGNKRTAVLAALVFADLNGYAVHWDQQEALEFVLAIAKHEIGIPQIVERLHVWMRRRAKRSSLAH